GIRLPARNIVVVHRSERSGSTLIWTTYLASVSSEWKSSVGAADTVHWPVGLGAEQNDGVANLVSKTPDSIGYLEFIYAINHQLDYGAVRNGSGRFIQADLASLQAAALDLISGRIPGPNSYPIASMTYFLIPEDFGTPAKRDAMLAFLAWMFTTG